MSDKLIEFVRDYFGTKEFIPLHVPTFSGREKEFVLDTLESTFVSSVGSYVNKFEEQVANYTGASQAIAVVNGTAALHTALYMVGVKPGDLVITQALTFVATCNALYHMGAEPVFVDISRKSLGLCPVAVSQWLEEHAKLDDKGICIHKTSGRIIRAIIPMHTFGHPVELDELLAVCSQWKLSLVEDAAESLGSFYKKRHTGTFGDFSALSFNGNKVITTGGGGMVLCNDPIQGQKARHLTTTAKVAHPYEYYHDEAGFNYRLPNLNAALGCGQMDRLISILQQKRQLAEAYANFFKNSEFEFVLEPDYAESNYWLNAIVCSDKNQRDSLLESTNNKGIMTRPVWQLMHRLPAFENAFCGELTCSEWAEAHLVNLPSSAVPVIR